mgnify:CR=1 FL=1
MKYMVDIDGTICSSVKNSRYELAQPIPKMVHRLNKLYNDGHTIKIMTARGCVSGKDWSDFTAKQLDDWGIKYHELIMNKKPHADVFVDDKAINAAAFLLLLGE